MNNAIINDDILKEFSECKSLITLNKLSLKNCNNITADGIEKIIQNNNFAVDFDVLSLI